VVRAAPASPPAPAPDAGPDALPVVGERPAVAPPRTPAPDRFARGYAFVVLLLGTGAFFPLAEADLQALTFALWVLAYAVAVAGLLHDRLRHRRAAGAPALLTAFVVLALASTAWSAVPDITVRRAVALAGTVVVGVYLAGHLRPVEVFDALRRVVLVVAVSSLVLWAARSPLALDEVHGTLRGVLATKNTLGRVLAVGVLAALAVALLDRARRRRALVSAGVVALPLVLTDSAGGLLLAAAAAGAAALVAASHHRRWRVVVPGLAAVGLAALVLVLPRLTWDEVAGTVGRDATLTGRTEIWSASLDALAARPALGYGYGAFWNLEQPVPEAHRIRTALYWDVPSSHNGVLDAALDLGWAGAALAVALVLLLVARGLADLRAGRRDLAALRLAVAALTVVANVVESGLLQQNSLWTVLLVVALAVPAGPPPEASRRPAGAAW
jgi:O-antigen ligase